MTKTKQQRKQKKQKSTSKMNIMRGVGKYTRGAPRRLKGRGGYAEDIGGSIGSWLGQKAGSLFKSITGLGKYDIRQNTLVAKPSDPPIVSNTNSGTRIQHREYIQDIVGSTAFAIQTFPINPGLSQTFPWLCSVSNAFEEYKLHGILFEFKSTSASALNSTNTALGTVIMATEYNPLHGAFTAKRDMENYVYSTSSPPDQSALHPIECARDVSVLDELFVRNVPITGSDLRFSDIGLFQIATVGMQAAATIGELWVTYDVELLKPKLPDAFTSIGPAHYMFSSGSYNTPSPLPTAPVTSDYFGTPTTQKLALRGTGVSPVTLSGNSMTFTQTGRFYIFVSITGSATGVGTAGISGTGYTPISIMSWGGNLTAIQQAPVAAGVTAAFQFSVTIDVQSVGAIMTWNTFVIPTGVTSFDMWVMPLPIGFTVPVPTETEKLFDIVAELKKQIAELALVHQDEDEKYIEDYNPSDSDNLPPSAPVLRTNAPRSVRLDLSASTSSIAAALLDRLTVQAA